MSKMSQMIQNETFCRVSFGCNNCIEFPLDHLSSGDYLNRMSLFKNKYIYGKETLFCGYCGELIENQTTPIKRKTNLDGNMELMIFR